MGNTKNWKRTFIRITAITAIVIVAIWTALTIWVELKGPKKSWTMGEASNTKKVLIVYDPDPIYNLDEQVCKSFGQALAESGMQVQIKTISAAEQINTFDYNLYVFCANTYNWEPDWAISEFIEHVVPIDSKPVVAITLGSGSTSASQEALEKIIKKRNGKIIGSRSFWLLKPNDESRMKESNVDVSVSMVYNWAKEIEKKISND